MKKKGFTLIELLAVIVVLAIIAVIATPMVLNTIDESRQGAAKASATSYVKAIETKVASDLMENKVYEDKDDYAYDEIQIDIKGTNPTGGLYSLKDGVVTAGTFCINGYEVKYQNNKTEVQGKCTGEDLKLSGSVKLSEASGYYEYPNTGTFEIIENISGGTLSCTSNDEEVATCLIEGTTVTVTPGKKEGVANLTIKSEGSSKYKEAQAVYVVTTKKGLISYTANGYNGTYDGAAHGITVIASGATIKYGTSNGSYTLDASPKYTDVGEYTVYYQVTRAGYKTVTGSEQVVISKAPGPTQILATNGETYKAIVYLDPTDLTKTCDASNSVSTTGTKEGCMKWYAYSDDGTNYTMILDHNTTALVAWNSSGSNSHVMNEVAVSLTSDTDRWTSGLNPRLITADEVAEITGATEALAWDSSKSYASTPDLSTTISYFYLDGAAGTDTTWHTQIATSQGTSKYAWLYDYTNGCISYGCNVEDSSNNGYWTSTPVAGTGYAWNVIRNGILYDRVGPTSNLGVRPVITLSKSILS